MHKQLKDYFLTTPKAFYKDTRRELCAAVQGCVSVGLQLVTTADSASITFTGDGTDGNPLTAETTGSMQPTIYTADSEIIDARTVTVSDNLRFLNSVGLNYMEAAFNPTTSVINLDVRDADDITSRCSVAPISGVTLSHQDPTTQLASNLTVYDNGITGQSTDPVNGLTNNLMLAPNLLNILYIDTPNGNSTILNYDINGFTIGYGLGTGVSTVFNVHPDGTVEGSPADAANKFVTQSQLPIMITATSPPLTFGEIAANSFEDLGLDVPGAEFGDVVALGIPIAAFVDGVTFFAGVSNDSPGVVTIRCSNGTLTPRTVPEGEYKVTVFKS